MQGGTGHHGHGGFLHPPGTRGPPPGGRGGHAMHSRRQVTSDGQSQRARGLSPPPPLTLTDVPRATSDTQRACYNTYAESTSRTSHESHHRMNASSRRLSPAALPRCPVAHVCLHSHPLACTAAGFRVHCRHHGCPAQWSRAARRAPPKKQTCACTPHHMPHARDSRSSLLALPPSCHAAHHPPRTSQASLQRCGRCPPPASLNVALPTSYLAAAASSSSAASSAVICASSSASAGGRHVRRPSWHGGWHCGWLRAGAAALEP
jgi:hypothetical protein